MADDSPLIVPIDVQALVANEQVVNTTFHRWNFAYANVLEYRSPEPNPFDGGQKPEPGVYLHWTLPSALRRGLHSTTSAETEWPLLPNRWLVVRWSGELESRVARGWVIESDSVGSEAESAAYLDPFATTPVPAKLGRVNPLPFQETLAQPSFLRAIAPGNLSFLSFQPFVANVFSMRDPVDDVADLDTLTYLVAGWYSNPADDILAKWDANDPATFDALLNELGWDVIDRPVAATARTSVYEGFVRELAWQRTGEPPSTRRPKGETIQVAIGNTSIDAFTAMIANAATGVDGIDPKLLEAFQYDLLEKYDDPDGALELEAAIYGAWFGEAPGDALFEIVDVPGAPPSDGSDVPEWLYALNRAQRKFDADVRALASKQYELWSLWFKRQRNDRLLQPVFPPEDWARELTPPDGVLIADVYQRLKQLELDVAALPHGDTADALNASIEQYAIDHALPDGRQLKRRTANPFFQANDPVVLFRGLGSDMLIDDDVRIGVRFPELVISGFHFDDGGTNVDVTAQSIGGVPMPDLTNLPAIAPSLAAEAFFLDPTDAAMIAAKQFDASKTDAIRAAMENAANDIGTRPSLGLAKWSQPWSPLFLAWEISFYDIDFMSGATPNWTFDGNAWKWTGTRGTNALPATKQGRIFLTPQCSFNFKARIEKYLEQYPDAPLEQLVEFIDTISTEWDFLSQSLDGLTAQLITREPKANRAPDASEALYDPDWTMAKLTGAAAQLAPLAGPVDATAEESVFQPLRSGQFVVTQLAIVDRFGQSVDVLLEEAGPARTPIVIAPGLKPEQFVLSVDADKLVQLTPRVLQPARIAVDLIDAADDAKAFQYDAEADPVCAWMLPNHIDQSLACYAPDGTAIGDLRAVVDLTSAIVADWSPSPDSPYATLDDVAAAFPHLGAMLIGVRDAGGLAFRELMRVIDSTLWNIDPLGDRDDPYLSVLIGRPLALVRTRIALELNGAAVRDQSWYATFSEPTPPILGWDFPLRIGDAARSQDGLLGYFAGDNYGVFNAAHDPGSLLDPYIAPIGVDDNWLRLRFNGDAAFLTMLIDPRAAVHVISDLLPIATIAVPPALVATALARMDASFRVGPLLTATQTLEDGTTRVVLPNPAQQQGTWSWIERDLDASGGSVLRTLAIAPADNTAQLTTTPPVLRSGTLKLTGVTPRPRR